MRIGELADRLSVNPQTIRFYERIGLLPDPQRTPAGYRIYSEDDLERVTFIKTAQRLNITLDEIREILSLRDRRQQPCGYVRSVLRREVEAINRRIDELAALRDELEGLDTLADQFPATDTDGACPLIDHVRTRS
jgi:DNA-binding transcriptional MerR regulator